ncbi:BT2A2 protein, partial [Rhinopomastus cyanomelas]|nr:BT2A2 protein [Rhinopomastus cyanomelas]
AEVVTLDPDTAHPKLTVSPDGRSVSYGSNRRNLPDTPERFNYWCCVLGRESFREGRHCWEVEVEGEEGGSSWWAVGVASKSVDKRGSLDLCPQNGVWAVGDCEGQFEALTDPRT